MEQRNAANTHEIQTRCDLNSDHARTRRREVLIRFPCPGNMLMERSEWLSAELPGTSSRLYRLGSAAATLAILGYLVCQ